MRRVNYVTTNVHKHEELRIFKNDATFTDGTLIRDVFEINVRPYSIQERLEIDLEVMVRHEVIRAYKLLKVPCIVEHAGLVFDGFEAAGYPGGLTKPMWNALGERFTELTGSGGKGATAKAVVAYCDGMTVHTFVGTTHGRLAETPRGARTFYWDTVFIPDDPNRPGTTLTYAEIVSDPSLGLEYKVLRLSQSTQAMVQCLQFIRQTQPNQLWA